MKSSGIHLEFSCGYMNCMDAYIADDNTTLVLETSHSRVDGCVEIRDWNFEQLRKAADVTESCQDYDVAERRFVKTLYDQGCLVALSIK